MLDKKQRRIKSADFFVNKNTQIKPTRKLTPKYIESLNALVKTPSGDVVDIKTEEDLQTPSMLYELNYDKSEDNINKKGALVFWNFDTEVAAYLPFAPS